MAISSLITLIRIALGDAAPASCALGIPSGAQVDVALDVQAVNNALSGCVAAPETPTFTAVPTEASTPTPTAPPTGSTPCPAGQHKACHGGSGRGGGYKTICNCVTDPPLVCRTAWGTSIGAGTSLTLYDANRVNAPDTCSAHSTVATCDVNGVLDPPGATGYPVCTVVVSDGAD